MRRIADLSRWVDKNGSRYLKRKRQEGFTWAELARKEYVDKILAKMGLDKNLINNNYKDSGEYTMVCTCVHPSNEHLLYLNMVRGLIGDLEITARVILLKHVPKFDRDKLTKETPAWLCGYAVDRMCQWGDGIQLDITCPDGRVVHRYIDSGVKRSTRYVGRKNIYKICCGNRL